ncbi:alpha/beta hydrolase [Erythrobacter sp. W53]|uniref:alpha/beta hydrolase n=1 Tax=Erythrobacter sp. W53 TaxID=3425947 RepID=UPI003D766A83
MASLQAKALNLALPMLAISRFSAAPELIEERLPKMRARPQERPRKRLHARFDITEDNSRGYPLITLRSKGGAGEDARHLLYLHGGGYIVDIADVHYDLVGRLCDATGASVSVPLYPLAPETKAVDVLGAMRALYGELAEQYGAHNITIMGDSAGGGMSLALAQMLKADGGPLPGRLVLYSPWLDAAASGEDQPELAKRDRMLTIGMLRKCGELYRGDLAVDDPRVSPLHGELEGLPPMAIFAGTRDVLVSDARRLVERLQAPGMPEHTYHEYADMMHVWMAVPIPEAKKVIAQTAQFLKEAAA